MSRTVFGAFIRTHIVLVLLSAIAFVEQTDNNFYAAAATEELSTPEPDASPGCKAPDIRFTKPRILDTTTEPPYAQFETTQIYLPEDFTTSDIEFVERINIDLSGGGKPNDNTGSIVNPYQIDLTGGSAAAAHDDVDDEMTDSDDSVARKRLNQNRKLSKKRRAGSGRRRRIENENGQSRGGRGSRYKRQAAIIHKDHKAAAETDKWSGSKLGVEGDVYYVHIEDLLKSRSLNNELRQKLRKMKKSKKVTKCSAIEDDRENVKNSTTQQQIAPGMGNTTTTTCSTMKKTVKRKKTEPQGNLLSTESKNPATNSESRVIMTTGPIAEEAHNNEIVSRCGGASAAANCGSSQRDSTGKHHRHRGDSHQMEEELATTGEKKENSNGAGWHNHRVHEAEKRIAPNRMRRSAEIATRHSDYDDRRDNKGDSGNPVPLENRRKGEYKMRKSSTDESTDNVNGNNDDDTFHSKAAITDAIDSQAKEQLYDANKTMDDDNLQRVKRKSGKTTGALSRPKGGGDSGSKTTSRKDKGIFDEEGYSPVHPDEGESEEVEIDEEDLDDIGHFTEVSEIRFPGEIGPLGDRRLCKIRCVKGKWVGPLCATNEEDDHGNIKFQPLYKSCHVNRIPPHLLLSYRNISVNVGWDLPHGHSLQARCKELGLYKLLGESRVLCSNGLWAPRMPSCVPTTLLTNFSDDSAPSIKIKIGSGSGAFEPSGVLAVLPSSTIHLDCMYPRQRGTPEWTWTSWYMQYNTGWSTVHEEKSTKYRLTIKDIQNSDSGTFTCTSPRGLTNSIAIIVATSTCPKLPEPLAPLSLRLEGNKLGQRALYRCPLGFRVEGTINATCLASGNWSSAPPSCQSVQCPRLNLEDSHLSLVELNTSAWGRAVFKCQWGFKLNGPPGLECEPSGVWSGPVPRCRAIQCPTPLVPLNGRIGGTSGSTSHRRYAVGALVTFSCNEGHILVGEASIVCTETGFWSHPPPFCKSQCPYPGDPPNGLIAPLKFNYDSGDYLSVQCRPGFVEYSENGPPERPKCLPDGNWSGPVPQCRSYEEV